MILHFDKRTELAPNIWEYSFLADADLSFSPGQYATFSIPSVEGDPRGSSRVFTLTSEPNTSIVSFILKIGEGESLYKAKLEQLVSGETIHMNAPIGSFVLPKSATDPMLFVAGGIGIASFVSILATMRAAERDGVTLLYSLADKNQDIMHRINNSTPRSVQKYIRPHKLTPKDILRSWSPNTQIYVSGSQRFALEIIEALKHHGIPKHNLHFDYYEGYKET